MRQKIVIILALFYSIQLIVSCCPEETIENTIRDVSFTPFILEDNRFVEVTESDMIDKEDLLLDIILRGDQINVASLKKELSKLGTQSAHASIDCDDPTFIFKNRINSIEIFAVDTNNADTEITGDLVIMGSNQSITDYVSENLLTVFDSFSGDFSNTNNLPATASFRIELFLDDGMTVITETNQINFN